MLRSGPRVVPGVILGLGSEKSEQELFLLGGEWGLWGTTPCLPFPGWHPTVQPSFALREGT